MAERGSSIRNGEIRPIITAIIRERDVLNGITPLFTVNMSRSLPSPFIKRKSEAGSRIQLTRTAGTGPK